MQGAWVPSLVRETEILHVVCAVVLLCQVASVVSDSLQSYGLFLPGPLSMGFSRQEYWSQWPRPPSGDRPDPRLEHLSPMSPALAGGFFTTNPTCCGAQLKK